MNFQEVKDMIFKLRRTVEDYYFDHKESLSDEQKTELNELYFALQQAEKSFERFIDVTTRK